MRILRWYGNGKRAAAAGTVALVMAWCGGASAQPLPVAIAVDENCHGTGNDIIPLPCSFLPDPGPGGLSSAMTYNLLGPPSLVAGDLQLTDGTPFGDLVRFNPQQNGGSVVFYSDNIDGVDALADIGPPGAFYTNLVFIHEVGPEGNNGAIYVPTAGQPGFVAGFAVTYIIHSDTAPEPATLALLALGLAGLGFSRRRKLN